MGLVVGCWIYQESIVTVLLTLLTEVEWKYYTFYFYIKLERIKK